jgi:hypothetical protein
MPKQIGNPMNANIIMIAKKIYIYAFVVYTRLII